jgi:uncharacterized protein YjgD (DUF1641 family)
MSDKLIQEQIDDINRKLDLIIDEVTIQRQNREAVNDLLDDAAVIGKDAFRNLVIELDDAGIELDGEVVRSMIFKLVRNIGSLSMVIETLESLNDLVRDLTPVIRQVGLDGINKFHDLEQKGYFELLNQLGIAMDSLMSRYSREQLSMLSGNLVPLAESLFILTNPSVTKKIRIAASALRDIDTDNISEYSVWRMMREMNKPEVKKTLGFIMAFISTINKENAENNNNNLKL